jgi:hypothetical protein
VLIAEIFGANYFRSIRWLAQAPEHSQDGKTLERVQTDFKKVWAYLH